MHGSNMPTVYLAGPIAGLNFKSATGWRRAATDAFERWKICALSPLRAKDYLADVQSFSKASIEYGQDNVLSTPRGIMTRDRYDATNCDVLLVNLLGATAVSIGTVMEMAWADAVRTPIVLVMEPSGNPHEHAMVLEATGFRVSTLEEGISVVKAILGVKHG